MRGFNKAIIMGNLARDPELRYTQTQRAVASFTVAVNRQWKDQNGEAREEAVFIPVVVWGKGAEVCERYLKKGSGVLVEGRINVRSYEAQTGERRYVTEIIADTFQFVGARRDGAPQGSYADGASQAGGFSQPQREAVRAPRSFRAFNVPPFPTSAPADNGGASSIPADMPFADASVPGQDEADIPF